MTDKSQFVWVRVGDGDPEPAALEGTVSKGRKATTIGCPDPFMIDEPGCPCRLLYEGYQRGSTLPDFLATLEPPDQEISAKEAGVYAKQYRSYMKSQKHSYAGFGRRKS